MKRSASIPSAILLSLAAGCTPAPRAEPAHPAPAAAAAEAAPAEALPFGVRVAGHGPAMILIPGLGSSGDVWNTTVGHEQDRFTCHVIDLPGFAGRPRIPAPMLATVRDALAGYIRAHHLDHPVIVGHSLGGFLALDLARTHPDAVGKLVIVDSLPFLPAVYDPAATAESMRARADALRARMSGSDPASQQGERAMIATMITDPAQQEVAMGWYRGSDRTALGDAMVEMMTTDLRPQLAAITAPALVVEATRGLQVERDVIERNYAAQYRELRGAKLVAAGAARHFVMLDDPAFLFAQMDAFLP